MTGFARARLLIEAHRPEQALAELGRLPAESTGSAEAFYLRATALLELERWVDAADAARRGLAAGGPNPTLLGQLGTALRELGDYPMAERALLDALALAPSDAYLLCRYAQLCLGAGQVDKAAKLLARAMEQDPHAPIVYATRVQLAYGRGDDREAERISSEFLGAYPDHPMALALRGFTSAQRGRVGESYESFRQAAAARPADPDYAEAAWEVRVYAHPLLRPLRPLYRLGTVKSWLLAVGIMLGLRAVGLRPLAALFGLFWLAYCVYSWLAPPLVRRMVRPRR